MKPAARSDLAMCDVRDEVVVYDFRSHQARCLNQTAAAVFKLCDGTRTPRQIAAELTRTLGAPCDEPMVWMALAKLDEGALFDPPLGARAVDLDRRRLLKKMALTAGLSIALPAVWSIVAPTPAYAASTPVTCLPAAACAGGDMGQCCNMSGVAGSCSGGTCSGTNSTCHGQPCR
ncbi:MAG: hypothetical protein JWM53_3617 [bacterium]|nr:hypothetical protein [bacterium]